jgi:valyl-tRNA synthetase
MLDSYPNPRKDKALASLGNSNAAAEVEVIKSVLHAIRNIRGENRISPAKELTVRLQIADDRSQKILTEYRKVLQSLGRVGALEIADKVRTSQSALTTVVASGCTIQVVVPLEGLVDLAEEIKRIQKNIEKIDKSLEALSKRLSNENFVKHAASEVVENDKNQMESLKLQRHNLMESLIRLRGES